jgi:hypothetical protein
MCTWVAIGVVVLLVLIVGAWRSRRIPKRTQVDALVATLGKRYLGEDWSEKFAPATSEQMQKADHLIGYADRILERQVAKAQGLLPFNAIILAVMSFERGRLPDTLGLPTIPPGFLGGSLDFVARALERVSPCEIRLFYLLVVTMIALALSSLLCLKVLSNRWRPIRDYESFHQDVSTSFQAVRARSKTLEWATVIAQASVIVAVVLIACAEVNVKTPSITALADTVMPAQAGL